MNLSQRYRRWCAALVSVGALGAAFAGAPLDLAAQQFRRGDVNLDGIVTLADASRLVDFFIGAAPAPRCDDSADANDSGQVNEADPIAILDWLERKVSVLPPPFQNRGVDPTADGIGCADPALEPPAPPAPGYAIEWEGPEVLRPDQKGASLFLRATTGAAIDGFSIACRVSKHLVFKKADLGGTIFPAARQGQFLTSPFFRVALVASADPDYRLLLVAAIFVDSVRRERIFFPASTGPIQAARLLRLEVDVAPGAPQDAETRVLVPAIDLDRPIPGAGGLLNEFIRGGSRVDPATIGELDEVFSNGGEFIRGDSNCSGEMDIADPMHILFWSFVGGVESCCMDAMDANDDGAVGVADATFSLAYLFAGGAEPPYPGPRACGFDERSADELSPLDCFGFGAICR